MSKPQVVIGPATVSALARGEELDLGVVTLYGGDGLSSWFDRVCAYDQLLAMVHRYGDAITEAADGADDSEGDRAYFGSTNTLDRLRELRQQHFEWAAGWREPGPSAVNSQLVAALEAAAEELRMIRMKDCDRVYNPTLTAQIDLALAAAKGEQGECR